MGAHPCLEPIHPVGLRGPIHAKDSSMPRAHSCPGPIHTEGPWGVHPFPEPTHPEAAWAMGGHPFPRPLQVKGTSLPKAHTF